MDFDGRERVRQQVAQIQRAHKGQVEFDSVDPADYRYLYVRDRVLAAGDDNRGRLDEAIGARSSELRRTGVTFGTASPRSVAGIYRYRVDVPDRSHERFDEALEIIDDEAGPGVITPDHVIHVSATIGNSKPCPASEPEETGLDGPWPPVSRDLEAGAGINVAVVDTGWHAPAASEATTPYLSQRVEAVRPRDREPYPQSRRLAQYAGHGTFIAGVVKARAPGARVRLLRYGNGGGVPESVLVDQLYRALAKDEVAEIIVLSAGCHTRRDLGLSTFLELWRSTLSLNDNTVLVAAAGNDGSDQRFYPAAHPWAVGVGSLDHDGQVSSFSNYGHCADVFVLGRNHVNAFPRGHYVCKEPPNVGDLREFTNGLARWSGTSFAAPLFAGLLARRLPGRPAGRSVKAVAWRMVNQATQRQDPVYGQHKVIHRRTYP